MIFGVLIIFIALLILTYVYAKDIFSPEFVVTGVWFFAVLMHAFYNHHLYPVTSKFLVAISLWVFFFVLFAQLATRVAIKTQLDDEPNKFLRNIFFYISVASFVVFAISAIQLIIKYQNDPNILLVLRLSNIGVMERIGPKALEYFVPLWFVSYLIELIHYRPSKKSRLVILFLIVLAYSVVTMAKTNFLLLFFSTVCILYYKNRIKIKTILIAGGAFFLLLIGFQLLRTGVSSTKELKSDFFSTYALSGMSAFETVSPYSSQHFGENTFRLGYAVANRTGLSAIPPVNPILEYVYAPVPTNVYTTLYPFYKDFGIPGIIIFVSLLGFIFGLFYKALKKKSNLGLLYYAYFLHLLPFQLMGDGFYTSLSMNMQILILGYIAYCVPKLIVKKDGIS